MILRCATSPQQSPSRAHLAEVEEFRLPTGKILSKINALALWTTRDVWQYAREHDIPLLPLYDAGYSSIGCEPCTTVPLDPLNPRSVAFQVDRLRTEINLLPGAGRGGHLSPAAKEVLRIHTMLVIDEPGNLTPKALNALADDIAGLYLSLSRAYFA